MSRPLHHQVPVLNYRDFIAADGEVLTTTSVKVAAVFGKDHAKVLLRIRALIAELGAGYESFFGFIQIDVDLGNGRIRKDPAYLITRDGFALLVMGFTGKKALAFKVAYIKAFSAMAAYVKNQRDGLTYRFLEKELECKDSARRGSFHGRGLNERKQEKPVLEAELAALKDKIQPSLLAVAS